ncbi:MAG: hypothetical protein L0H59_17905 [Tomitella sp.]|nr:hypothetical protein [Tomitella sp.]
MRYTRPAAAVGAVLAIAVGLSGCKSTSALEQEYVSTDIVVGSGMSTESRVVAEIYADALRGSGIEVSTDLGVGDRLDYVRALESGRISVVPDDTASLLAFFRQVSADKAAEAAGRKSQVDSAATSPDAKAAGGQASELSTMLPGYLRISDAALASREQSLVITDGSARQWNVHTVSELASHCGNLEASVVAGLVSDAQLRNALADDYDCRFADVQVVDDAADAAAALGDGSAEVAAVTNLSPAAHEDGLTVLDDDRDALPGGNLVPLFRAGTLQDEQIRALNKVAGELTSKDLGDMVRKVDVDGRKIGDVVGDWRAQHG